MLVGELDLPDGNCFLCEICSKTFSKAWGLKKHKKIHLGLKGKNCPHCLKTFPDQLNLEEHKVAEHANREYSEQFRSEAVEMVAKVGIVRTASEFMLHESTLKSWMTNDGENYCSECHKSFKFDSYLKNHMKVHANKEGKPLKIFKEKRFSEALKKQVIGHVKLYSVKSAGQEFGLGDSTVRSILKADSFPCNLCDRKCAYRGQLQRHMLEVHKVKQLIKLEENVEKKKKAATFPCTICERKCANKKQLERHMLIHPVEELVKPDHIRLKPKNETRIEDANEAGNGKPKVIKIKKKYAQKGEACDYCQVVTKDMKQHLVKHDKLALSQNEIKLETDAETTIQTEKDAGQRRTRKPDKLKKKYVHKGIACDLCGKVTKDMKQHLVKHNKKTKRKQKEIQNTDKIQQEEISEGQNLKEDALQENETKDTITKPDRKDGDKTRNEKSEKIKKKKKTYKQKGKTCDHCGLVTKDMTRHLVKHDKKKPFKCDQCETAFGLKFNLKRHIDLHHNPEVELFSCSKCTQRLTTTRTLLMHEARHVKSEMKPTFQCNVCNDISSTRGELRKHCAVTKHQILRGFSCATCTKAYINQQELTIHNDVVHLKLTNHPCKICGKLFGRASSLRAHLNTIHTEEGRINMQRVPSS